MFCNFMFFFSVLPLVPLSPNCPLYHARELYFLATIRLKLPLSGAAGAPDELWGHALRKSPLGLLAKFGSFQNLLVLV